eukprot:COSAG04_NODE_25386_length_308_cov_0.827751_1_plen_20_part_01
MLRRICSGGGLTCGRVRMDP